MSTPKPRLLEGPPEWDDTLFDGEGGFKGEETYRYIMCDLEYDRIIPWDNVEYVLFSHDKYCRKNNYGTDTATTDQ